MNGRTVHSSQRPPVRAVPARGSARPRRGRQMSGHVSGLSPAPLAPAFPQPFEGRQGHGCHCELIPGGKAKSSADARSRLLFSESKFRKERRESESRARTLEEGQLGWGPGQPTAACRPFHRGLPREEGCPTPLPSGWRAGPPAVLGPGASRLFTPRR